jgi:hypothetical protein
MKPTNASALASAFQGLSLGGASSLRQIRAPIQRQATALYAARRLQNARPFSTTPAAFGTWLEPSLDRKKKMAKGRPRVATGGSTKGTTVMWGDYGLRMVDHHRRISAKSLKMAEDTIKNRLRGEKYRLYKRKNCNIGVFVSGNDVSRCEPKLGKFSPETTADSCLDAYGQGKGFFRPLGHPNGREPDPL